MGRSDSGWYVWSYQWWPLKVQIDLAVWSLALSVGFRKPRYAYISVGPLYAELSNSDYGWDKK